MLGTQTRDALCPYVLNGDSDRFERLVWKHGKGPVVSHNTLRACFKRVWDEA